MEQSQIIPEVQRICAAGEYDRAIALTNQIANKRIAVEAHLLCIEHEERRRLNSLTTTEN